MFGIIALVAVVALGLYVMSIYNRLQQLKTQIVASIQEIGNQLKRQASLIPNLQSVAKSYLEHEKAIYDKLTEARKSVESAQGGDVKSLDQAINQVQSLIPQIRVVMESNPELKSNESINKFMNELTDTADKLMYARRSVIDLSQKYNENLVMFPSNLVANMFGFTPEKGLETPQTGEHISVSESEMKDPKVEM